MGFGIGEDGENTFHQCERDHYSIQLIEWSRIGLRKGTEVDLPDCLGGLGGAWGVTENTTLQKQILVRVVATVAGK